MSIPYPEDGDQEIVMPFIACQSQGGVYDDESFVAGFWLGKIWSIMAVGGNFVGNVPEFLVPQLDLAAMHYGMQMSVQDGNEEIVPGWAMITIV